MRLAHHDPATVAEYRRRGWWGDETVGDAVARWAQRRPSALAFIDDTGPTTWAEYDANATRVAGAIVAAGVPRGSRLAVWLPDGAAVHEAYVGAERAGVTVVGIGSRAGDHEVRHLLAKTHATGIVTPPELRGRAAGAVVGAWRAEGIEIEHHFVLPIEAPTDPVAIAERRYGPDDVFMINSTSGTTGLPKCVLHNENRWMFFHQLALQAGDLGSDDIFFSLLPAPFGFGLWTAHFTPAVLGATTVLAARFDAADALRTIEREQVTVLACVSTQFVMMLQAAGGTEHDLSSLRCMFTGGEMVPYEAAAQFEDRTGARVLQFYGSNETGVLSGTTLRDDREHRLTTAGRPIPEMQVRLLDDEDRDITEPFTAGHPVCKGPATCFGYLDDAVANEQLLTDDGWMRIGDLCELDADGYLRVVGRTSDIIIRGGKNISAPAVEREIATHPAVGIVAAVSMPDEVFGERVCAYVELRPGTSLTFDDLIAHLEARGVSKEWLPERLVVLDELPRASGGKVAKGALRDDIRRRVAAEKV